VLLEFQLGTLQLKEVAALILDQLEIGELEQQILPMTSQKQPVTITLVEY
jgi:hypothetical protein